jgi:hypothetical protein
MKTEKLYLTEEIYHQVYKSWRSKGPRILFYLTVTNNLNFHQEVRGDAISLLKEAFP